MKTIHVVFGVTGEYSDRTEWCVVAYPDEKSANDHADAANKWLPFDSAVRYDYNGAEYFVVEIPWAEKFSSAGA